MNESLLQLCLSEVEHKLGWSDSSLWTHQDFELLSDRIFEVTRVRLSSSTLKRAWGKVTHNGGPSTSTLNALAVFCGYNHWNDFKNEHKVSKSESVRKMHSRRPGTTTILVAGLILIAIAVVGLVAFRDKAEFSESDIASVSFSSQPVTRSLPNSVVFTYDFGHIVPEKATIQQSWNKRLTFSIDPAGHEATGIYYLPGYFRAKLLANDQILKEHDLYIKTEGWTATIENGEVPTYFYENEIQHDGILKLPPEAIEAQRAEEQARLVSFHYFNEFDNISGDNFIYEARFRSSYDGKNEACNNISLLVHGTEAVFIIPFSIPGCISDLYMLVAGREVSGKSNDLSAFGTNVSQWQNFRLQVADSTALFFLNDVQIHEEKADFNIGRIVGLRFRFKGAGEVDHVKLSVPGRVVFEDGFEVRSIE